MKQSKPNHLSEEIREFMPFQKVLIQKWIPLLNFELTNYNVAVLYVNHYTANETLWLSILTIFNLKS